VSDEPRKKGWGKTVLGWFVESDEEAPAEGASPDELIARYATAETPEVPVQLDAPPPPAAGGQLDFEGIFRSAGMNDQDLEHVHKAAELLRNLPQDTPNEIKRQIVEASLKAFGFPTERIIEAGVQEIQALHAYITQGQTNLQQLLQQSTQRLDALEKEMVNVRQVMQQSTEQQSQVAYACNLKKLEIQKILTFFGEEAVDKVVKESPKLYEPAG
jgi:hypothetical protein